MSTATQPKVKKEKITPAKATAWMKDAANVRPIRKHRVAAYEEKLRRRMMQLSNDAICIDVDGNLINGWHRCTAVVNTGIGFDALVIRDMPRSSTTFMDKGLKRQVSDALGDIEHRTSVAASARLLLGWEKDIVHNPTKMGELVPEEDIIAFALKHSTELVEASRRGFALYNAVAGTVTAWATMLYRAYELDPKKAEAFYDAILTGANLASGDPRLAVRNWFINQITTTRRHSTIPNVNALHIMAQGWNAWINGDTRAKLHLPRKGAKNINVPQLVKP
jgi:hypothetical protein